MEARERELLALFNPTAAPTPTSGPDSQ